MITLCTVCLSPMEPYLEVLLDSVCKRLNCISEVCITHVFKDEPKPIVEYTLTRHDGQSIYVKEITLPKNQMHHEGRHYGHAEGLHSCLDHATQDYVLFTDPDMFFYKDADEFYLENYNKYNLNIIGVCHHWAHNLAVGWFPLVFNCLVKRDTLPNKEWMKDYLKYGRGIYQYWLGYSAIDDEGKIVYDVDGTLVSEENFVSCPGKFLIQGCIPEFHEKFPNHNKAAKLQPIGFWWDIGCNLHLWNEERKGKWISFPTLDTHTYTAGIYRSNFKLKDKFKNQKLVYHLNNGYRVQIEDVNSYKLLVEKYKETL